MKNYVTALLVILFSTSIWAQTEITGVVTDAETNEPIPGVSIWVKGTSNGTTTDFDGNYSIETEQTDLLVFSYVGFKRQEIPVQEKSIIDVSLETELNVLDEVVLVGYGTQKKSDLTGAVSVVDVDEINKVTASTVDQALQGQVPGVDVTTNSGTPGGGVMVRIRGVGTLNDASPLFVVDGMMMDNIDFLNANDIESIQVLKDASSTAIYGSRGSNGVVIISTEKGDGEGRVSINASTGMQSFWRSTNLLDAENWARLRNEAMVASGQAPGVPNPGSLQNTDWFEEVTNHNAIVSSTNVSTSGGSEKGNYFISGNYFDQKGVIKKTSFNRVSFRANSSYKVKPWLTIGENATLVKTKQRTVTEEDEFTSLIITSIAKDPASPVRNEDGTFAQGLYNDTWNPAAIIDYTNNEDVVYRTIGNIYADFKLTEDFTFKSNYSVEYSFGETDSYDPVYYVSAVQQNATSRIAKNNSSRFINQWTSTLNYERSFGAHSITALVGIEQFSTDYKYNGMVANNVPSDDVDVRYLDNATGNTQATVNGSIQEVRQSSYLTRLNYSYKDKYLLTANFRADASSKFSKKNRWGYFPSFSAGWKVSEENFLKDIDGVNDLKIRAGWGQIGNQGSVPPYQDVTTASPGANYLWGGVLAPGYSFPGAGNDEIKWETSTTLNFGLDYGLFRNRLSGSIDYFIKKTTDMLLQVPVPAQTGIESPPTQNAGAMRNSGLEFSAQYRNMENKFKYSFGLIFSKIKNEVVDLGTEDAFIDGASFFNSYFVTRTTAGRPIAQFYGFRTDGLFQNQAEIDAQTAQQNVEPGDVRYVDSDNDGELDFFYLGSPLPDYTYSFNANLSYENFDFTLDLQGVQGNDIFNGTSQYKRSSTAVWNLGKDMLNRWTGENTQNDARYPRLNFNDANNSRMSDRFIEDGSYLRIKTLQLGYTLPQSYTDKMKISKLRLYVNAQNLFTFTTYSGLDPDIGMRGFDALDVGVDRGFYPQARIYSLGINLDL